MPRLSATRGARRTPGPALCKHGGEVSGVLLGLDEALIAALCAKSGI